MTAPSEEKTTDQAQNETVTAVIDGQQVSVPKGTMIIRAAELLGTEIPRFCDHPLLEPVAACRQCLVEIEGMPKPQPSCAIEVTEGMQVKTQETSKVAEEAQAGVMEFLLLNHPLDCPVCDKGGECPLQNQAMSVGRPESRYQLPKLTFPKPVSLSAQILLDKERCVNCARCTRFAEQIAGDPLIDLLERGAHQAPGVGEEPFDSYFSGNTIQICPVGALTSAEYRFRSRPFDLVSVPTTCEHCASGCGLRTDIRHNKVMRRHAWDEPEVNEEWNCDKGRFAFNYLSQDRLTQPLVREDGQLRQASWPEALATAAAGLKDAVGRAGVITGGRLTLEDAYAYSRFARVVLGSDNIDFRSRASSSEEIGFLGGQVAGTAGPTYADIQAAPFVLIAGLEPEEESPIVFLRLRKAADYHQTKIAAVAPFATEGLVKMSGRLIPAVPGSEAEALSSLSDADKQALAAPGAMILVGERLAGFPGALNAAAELATNTGAKLAWIPRRAGDRGAVDAGCLPGLLPGGRPLSSAQARSEVAAAWSISEEQLTTPAGWDLTDMLATIAADASLAHSLSQDDDPVSPNLAALIVAGVEPGDLPDPKAFADGLAAAPFVISLETTTTEVTAAADVVLPVAVVTEKSGTFVDWEGRRRPFAQTIPDATTYSDAVVLSLLSDYLDVDGVPGNVAAIRAEIESLGAWSGDRMPARSSASTAATATSSPDTAVLASWRLLLDLGVMQEGATDLAGTRRPAVARVSEATAAGVGVTDGELLTVSTDHGHIRLPLVTTEMPDGIVWVPFNSPLSQVTKSLGVAAGDTVRLSKSQGVRTQDGEA
ncbi:MAG: NADH-quinone oxidoreductase subunit G [Actinomycetia bacterium]|nr:NADH-quinone oxidoreductase subunit G [Actinomycetes bacterium]